MFEKINDHDITEVEKFVREELLDILASNAEVSENADVSVMDQQQLIDNFGELFMLNPQKFRFLPGDRKFIQLIGDHIRSEITRKGRKRALRHFGYEIERSKKSKIETDEIKENEIESIASQDDLKSKLFNQIRHQLKTLAVPESILDMFDETLVTLVNVGGKISGHVICIVCHLQSKDPATIKPHKVFCRDKDKSWVISNFKKHFTRAHSGTQISVEVEVEPNAQFNSTLNENNENNNHIATNQSVANVSMGSLNISWLTNDDAAVSTERLLNSQISRQMVRMWQFATINGECMQEVVCSEGDAILTVDITEIPQDGNCLFSSLAHQLFGNDINSSKHITATNKLRGDIVKHIQENYAQFDHELCGHVYELKESKRSSEINDISDLGEACNYLLNQYLTVPGNWGGIESLKAVVHLHSVHVIILYENGPIHLISSDQQAEKVVLLAYRLAPGESDLRNHYDSICNMSASTIYEMSKILAVKITQTQSVASLSSTID